jgi:hypothetical protein
MARLYWKSLGERFEALPERGLPPYVAYSRMDCSAGRDRFV